MRNWKKLDRRSKLTEWSYRNENYELQPSGDYVWVKKEG